MVTVMSLLALMWSTEMNTAQTSWNFRHIEFLIDVAEDYREPDKLSATKLKRFLALHAAGLVEVPAGEKYIVLTPTGKSVLERLENDLVDYIEEYTT